MVILKQMPEDFIVEEIPLPLSFENGPYQYIELKKINYDWYSVLPVLCEYFNVKEKDIGIAGIKDKAAITTQIISVKSKKSIDGFSRKDITLRHLGFGTKPISKGQLKANKFTIVVRELTQPITPISWMINYFDEQRFSENNVPIGLALLTRKYQEAITLLNDQRVNDYLLQKPQDYVGAIRQLPYNLLSLYAHAVQSAVWNEYVSSLCTSEFSITVSNMQLYVPLQRPAEVDVDILGFDSVCNDAYRKILLTQGLTTRSFINRALPALTCEGNKRAMVVDITDMVVKTKQVENEGAIKRNDITCTLTFTLPPGSYATMAIKQAIARSEQKSP